MGCNGNNHAPSCRCGWGGDGHKGKSPGGKRGYFGHLSLSQKNLSSQVETENRLTRCPVCQSEVAFIKHNGGSVWLDLPLGPPWYKHACFDKEKTSKVRSSLKTNFHETQKSFNYKTKIIVISFCVYNEHSGSTRLKANFDSDEVYSFSVRGDARIFVGRLCFVDESVKEVWPVDDYGKKLYYQGTLSKHLNSSASVNVGASFSNEFLDNAEKNKSKVGLECSICSAVLSKQKKYRSHLLKVHGVVSLSGKEPAGFLIVDHSKFYPGFQSEAVVATEALLDEGNDEPSLKRLNKSSEVKHVLRNAFNACVEESGWAGLANIGNWLAAERADFNVKDYGYKKLSHLVGELDYIAVQKKPAKNNPLSNHLYIKFIS
ncbi:OST-HTH/LOTUS domain-containing protein [Vreelandella stevensii]|uniref:OST-HTH/LOTUS domain-containing protein n=1 Tax=Vreelandella stevensii TaxID=502821 RepID=UPI00403A8EC0